MKLNTKRTLLVGLAFFLICAFWQAYDNTIPLILTNKFGMSQTWSGMIMALDNVLALFLLPLFGAMSDRCKHKSGRRTPYIMAGTILAAVLFFALSFVDAKQLTRLEGVNQEDYTASLSVLYDANPSLQEEFPDKEDFTAIAMYQEGSTDINPDYTHYVIPARNAYAWQQTMKNPVTLVFFILLLLGVLVSMGLFRSPAVALMPDVTPKPLRSKANAVINLMGSFGGILVLVLGMVFATGKAENALMSYMVYYGVIAAIMLISVILFRCTVKEPQWAAETEEEEEETSTGNRKLNRAELRSLIFILLSVALWYMGYNAVTSKYSVYAGSVLHMDYNLTLIIAQAAAILSYIPIGIISSRIGRKKAILAGVVILAVSFGAAAFMRSGSSVIVMDILFASAGIGWATINVNSYPMVVEMAKGGDVGKYTGYYYAASMAAQVITPVFSGVFLDISLTTLFPYATVFVILAFVTMLVVRHGDNRVAAKKGLEAFADMED